MPMAKDLSELSVSQALSMERKQDARDKRYDRDACERNQARVEPKADAEQGEDRACGRDGQQLLPSYALLSLVIGAET